MSGIKQEQNALGVMSGVRPLCGVDALEAGSVRGASAMATPCPICRMQARWDCLAERDGTGGLASKHLTRRQNEDDERPPSSPVTRLNRYRRRRRRHGLSTSWLARANASSWEAGSLALWRSPIQRRCRSSGSHYEHRSAAPLRSSLRVAHRPAADPPRTKIEHRLAVIARSRFATRQSDPQYVRLRIAASLSGSSQ
jgi:hypothetical protein